MNVKDLKEIIALMNENGLVELEIEREGLKVRVKKGVSGGLETSQGKYIAQPNVVLAESVAPLKETQAKVSKEIEIKAPMVGTFYKSPAPDAPAFVEIGNEIEPGQVLCVIEAMKLMNEIKSEVKGKIVDILVENAQPVEFGQALFLIEPVA